MFPTAADFSQPSGDEAALTPIFHALARRLPDPRPQFDPSPPRVPLPAAEPAPAPVTLHAVPTGTGTGSHRVADPEAWATEPHRPGRHSRGTPGHGEHPEHAEHAERPERGGRHRVLRAVVTCPGQP